jgi:hypothetical protein
MLSIEGQRDPIDSALEGGALGSQAAKAKYLLNLSCDWLGVSGVLIKFCAWLRRRLPRP